MFHNSILIIEPEWWQQLMIALNSWIVKHELLVKILPITADIFVFSYPVYLIGLYLRGLKKNDEYFKHASFAIVLSAALASITNQVIQYFGDKVRPETAIILKQNLILSHLPTDPFPSDHAAVSAAVAMATLLRWIKHKDARFLKASIFFWFASGAMCFSRVAVAIHRPMDILVWLIVWVFSALIILRGSVWKRLLRVVCKPLMQLQEKIWLLLGR